MDGATLECEKHRRFENLSEEEIKRMSLQSYKGYEKKRMEKNALYTYAVTEVAERINDAPVLKDYIVAERCGPEHLEMWLIKNTWPTPFLRQKND